MANHLLKSLHAAEHDDKQATNNQQGESLALGLCRRRFPQSD
jgi:hypothetical protein